MVVSTHLKNISQIGSFPQVGMKIENIWNHQLVKFSSFWSPQQKNSGSPSAAEKKKQNSPSFLEEPHMENCSGFNMVDASEIRRTSPPKMYKTRGK